MYHARNPYLGIGNRNRVPRHWDRARRQRQPLTTTAYGPVKPRLLFLYGGSRLNFEVTVACNAGNRIGDNVGISVSNPMGPGCSSPPHQSPDRFRPISRGRFRRRRRRFGGDENYGGRSGLNVRKHAPILYYYVLLSRKK